MADGAFVKVTVCGGGNGAHTLAGISSMHDSISVTVLDIFEDEPERWNDAMSTDGFTVNLPNGDKLNQSPGEMKFRVTRDVEDAIPSADVVIFVMPAYAHQVYFDLIIQYLSNNALVVGMPGQPGFEYQCLHYLRKHGKKCAVMSLETLPWACRINNYGRDVTVLGFKDEVQVSLIKQSNVPFEPLPRVQKILGEVPVLKEASHALEICLMAKAILHPPILFARWKDWNGEELESPPLFYQGVDVCAIRYLDGACNEVIKIAEKLNEKYTEFKAMNIGTVQQWLLDHYSNQISDKTSLLTTLQTNKAYDGLVHPMSKTDSGKYVPNFTYRYLREDVPFGILIQRAVAEMVGVKTPIIDEIITWAQGIMDTKFLVDGKINQQCPTETRIPQIYGLNTIEDLLTFCKSS